MINFGGTQNRVEDARLDFIFRDNTTLSVSGEQISMGGLVWDSSTTMDGQFTIGAAVTGKLSIMLFNDEDALSVYDFRDAQVTAYLTMEGAETATIMGVYTVGEFRYNGAMISLTCFDNLSKLDIPTSQTGSETLTWPMTIKQMINKACTICGVTLRNSTHPTPWDSYSITQQPAQWNSMTWHDVIGFCAQISGTFAKMDRYGRLYFKWYSMSEISSVGAYDGGTFSTTTTPYSDGDPLDGGTFAYNDGGTADGGTFGDRANLHILGEAYALTVDTDDVYITGLKVTLEASDNINAGENTQAFTTELYGSEGYVITIAGNPFIETTDNANDVRDFLGARVVGMLFRPMSATLVENPTIEAGDVALVSGRDGSTYHCFISKVTYTTNAATLISCDAEPTGLSSKARFTMADKIRNTTEQIERKVETVSKIAGNTNQYFWFTETGTDTGAHITEVPQDEWLDSTSENYHSGGNLLARSNGIAIRSGLTELAQFGTEVNVGQETEAHVNITSDGLSMYNNVPTECLKIGASTSQVTTTVKHVLRSDRVTQSGNLPLSGTVAWSIPADTETSVVTQKRFYCSFTENNFGSIFNGEFTVGSTPTRRIQMTTDPPVFYLIFRLYSSWSNGTLSVRIGYNIEIGEGGGSTGYVPSGTMQFQGMNYTVATTAPGPSFVYGSLADNGSIGGYSAAMGMGMDAAGDFQLAIGKYNDNDPNNAFEIGNGTATSPRTIMAVSKDGAVSVADQDQTRLNLGIDCGYSQFEVGAQAYVTNTVTFNKTFSEPPIVVAGFFSSSTGAGMGRLSCGVFDVTTTDCKIRVWSYDSSNRSPRVNWIAVGT